MTIDEKEIEIEICVENLMKVLDHYDIEIDDYKLRKIEDEFTSYVTDSITEVIETTDKEYEKD